MNIFFAVYFWLPKCIDFFSIISIDINLINPSNWLWFGFVKWIWSPIMILISMYICAEFLILDERWHISIIFVLLDNAHNFSI